LNLSFFIAKKYFFSKKKKNFINVISLISMLVVGIGTMALIIVLSVFNGLEGLLRSTYGSFDAEVIVSATQGKSFVYTDDLKTKIEGSEAIDLIAEVIEDNVLIKYKNAQRVVRMKGVSESFIDQQRLQSSLVYGELKLSEEDLNYAIIGRGVQYDLSINPNNDFFSLQVYYPKNIGPGVTNPSKIYNTKRAIPASIFSIEKYYDENYIIVSLDFATDLLSYNQKRTALEISLKPGKDRKKAALALNNLLGDDYTVRSGDQLHADLFKFMKWEKLIVFMTFFLIIAIASINIYFSLTMLVIDKKKDIATLHALGTSKKVIRWVFLSVGMIIAFTGASLGLTLGLIISGLQQEYGFVSMGMQSALMTAYPVIISISDVFLTAFAIIVITLLATIQPAILATKNLSPQS
jgi:lipoprotein-releasing system permease protein